jgi:hypothetical protein
MGTRVMQRNADRGVGEPPCFSASGCPTTACTGRGAAEALAGPLLITARGTIARLPDRISTYWR